GGAGGAALVPGVRAGAGRDRRRSVAGCGQPGGAGVRAAPDYCRAAVAAAGRAVRGGGRSADRRRAAVAARLAGAAGCAAGGRGGRARAARCPADPAAAARNGGGRGGGASASAGTGCGPGETGGSARPPDARVPRRALERSGRLRRWLSPPAREAMATVAAAGRIAVSDTVALLSHLEDPAAAVDEAV